MTDETLWRIAPSRRSLLRTGLGGAAAVALGAPAVHAAPWILLATLLAAVGWFLRVALGGSVS